jgi:hypothetical protein
MSDSCSKGIEFESVLSGSVFGTASRAPTLRFEERPQRWWAAVNVSNKQLRGAHQGSSPACR